MFSGNSVLDRFDHDSSSDKNWLPRGMICSGKRFAHDPASEHNTVARQFGIVFTLPEEIRSIYKSFGHDLAARNGHRAASSFRSRRPT